MLELGYKSDRKGVEYTVLNAETDLNRIGSRVFGDPKVTFQTLTPRGALCETVRRPQALSRKEQLPDQLHVSRGDR